MTPARVFSGIQPSGELHIGNWLGVVLADGAAKARRIAQETMRQVREQMGLGSGTP
jgi:tryptophanyl-tRNA synthetase